MRDKLIKLLEESGMIEGTSRCNIVADELLANGVIVPPCKVGVEMQTKNAKHRLLWL